MSSESAFFSSSRRSTRSTSAFNCDFAKLAHAAISFFLLQPDGLVLWLRLREGGLLLGARVTLVALAPFVVGHAVDCFATLVLGHGQPFGIGRVLHPVRQAVAAEAGKIHQVEVLHVRAL